MALVKYCTKCKCEFHVMDFHKNKSTYDGLQGWCKWCCSDYGKEYRKNDYVKERNKEYSKKYLRSEKGRKTRQEYYNNKILKELGLNV